MIKQFNDVEMRESAIIYQSNFEQIKKLYLTDPVMAGELAISICEMALTGQCSSDNGMIDIILENFKVSSNKNKAKYDKTLEVKRQKKINDQSLDKIAILLDKGYNQSQIARQLNISKQTISNRVKLIKSEFPELLSSEFCLTLDKNDNDSDGQGLEVKEKTLDTHLTTLDLSSRVKPVKSVKSNENENDNDNIESFAERKTVPLVSLEELNQMGVEYENISDSQVKIVKTGNICQVKG